jgi:hypothetical protein
MGNLPGGFLVDGDERKVACDSEAQASIPQWHREQGPGDGFGQHVAKRERCPSQTTRVTMAWRGNLCNGVAAMEYKS